MKKVILTRGFQDNRITLGILRLLDQDHDPIFTLENPWLFNKQNVSCIPPGDYLCKPFSGKKYREVYEVTKVPNRSYILFHSGNVATDTKGCILLGMSAGHLNAEPAVLQSRIALNLFKAYLGEDSFKLLIRQG